MRLSLFSATILAAPVALAVAAFAQQPSPNDQTLQSLRRDMDELIKGQLELQKQVQELKTLVQNQRPLPGPAAAPTPMINFDFDTIGAPSDGVAQAPLVMVELSDFQCPFCARFDKESFPAIEQNYVHTGKVRYFFKNFPLENIHSMARPLAEAAQCLSVQKDFWTVRKTLFANQSTLKSDQAMDDLAKKMGTDMNAYGKCKRDKASSAKVDQSLAQATAVGVSGTPTFLIGRSEPGATKFKVLKVIVGAQPFETFRQTFDSLLNPPAT